MGTTSVSPSSRSRARKARLTRRAGAPYGVPSSTPGSVFANAHTSLHDIPEVRRGTLLLPLLAEVEHGEKRFLRHLDATDLLHPLLSLLLLLEQLALARDVPAVALGEHVLALRLDRLASDHARSDRGLDRHVEELARDLCPQPLDELAATVVSLCPMDDERERVDLLTADENVDAGEVDLAEPGEVVVEARVPARPRFQLVVEVEDDLAERELVREQNSVLAQILHVVEAPAPIGRELHDRADVVLRHDHRGPHVRLLDHLQVARHLRRVVHLDDLAALARGAVGDVGSRDQEVEVELALEPLPNDLHVQETEKAAAEAEAEGLRRLRLVRERGVVQLQSLESVAQLGVLVGIRRKYAGEHHRLHILVAGQWLRRRAPARGERVADA